MQTHRKVMVVFGTRPEAIKMAPVISALRATPGLRVSVAVTAQHRQMLDQVLEVFGIVPEHDLDLMCDAQRLPDLFTRVVSSMSALLERQRPDMVVVHGDTITTFATAVAAFFSQVPVAHVEAGLRTGNLSAPWPEEANRRLTAPLALLHFAPTELARDNLIRENIAQSAIYVTGNTVIDALLNVTAKIDANPKLKERLNQRFNLFAPDKRTILVTGHRRENLGEGIDSICRALIRIAQARSNLQIVFPVHLNPRVRGPVQELLGNHPHIHLLEPLDYVPFVELMRRSHLILTDSGGIQEEAPSLGKPVLVLRDCTERPEAVSAGTVLLVGTSEESIVEQTLNLLDNDVAYQRMARAANPYGDGRSSRRIAAVISKSLGICHP